MPEWSEQQWDAISSCEESLLVSAAAGSGKTATLAQRCVHLTCLAEEPCDLTHLLVMTYTEAAAAEMKGRIEKAMLEAEAACVADENERGVRRVRRQLALLPGAQVSTIHGFCARLLRRHFQAAGLDPEFRVLDEQESTLLKDQTIKALFEERFASLHTEDQIFSRFIDLYADGRDGGMQEQVIKAHDVLRSLVDPAAWRTAAMARLKEVEREADFRQTAVGRELFQLAADRIEDCRVHARCMIDVLNGLESSETYVKVANATAASLEAMADELAAGQWPALPEIQRRKPGACPQKDLANALLESLTKQLKRDDGTLSELFNRTLEEIRDQIVQTIPMAECFLRLVEDFSEAYTLAKRQMHAADFADLEHLALEILRQEEGRIARECQQRYLHVMVDEFQDVNQVQWQLLEMICRKDSSGALSNLFCVGDVKQSIYRFRLADPTIFVRREKQLAAGGQGGREIHMRHNYRSRKPLLDAINLIFRELMHEPTGEIEYDQHHELDGRRRFPSVSPGVFSGTPIECHLVLQNKAESQPSEESETSEDSAEEDLGKIEREAACVAEIVARLKRENRLVTQRDGTTRPLRHGDIAILLRSARCSAITYARALEERGIPCVSQSRTGFFKTTEVNDLLSLLTLLDNQRQDIPMAAWLRSPLAGLPRPEDAMGRIRIAFRELPFHEAVVTYARQNSDDLAEQLRQRLDRLAAWRQRALVLPVADLLWEILSQTHYLAFCRGLKNGRQRVANILYLHRCARKFSHFQRQGLFRFIEYLNLLEEKSDLGQSSPGEAGDAVQVLTIHRSKGLEFPVVIVAGTHTKFNLREGYGAILIDRERHLALSAADDVNDIRYPTGASWLVRDQIRRASMAEELRVLYVAMTRAQEHLILVGSMEPKVYDRLRMMPSPGGDPHAFRSAQTALEWLLPVMAQDAMRPFVRMVVQGVERETPPVEPAAAETDDGEAIQLPLDLWNHEYPQPFATLTTLRAANSVTGISKAQETPMDITMDHEPADPPPLLISDSPAGEAAARGVAMHSFLEHFDFSPAAAPVMQQMAAMVERRLLTPQQAKLVDPAAIQWLLSTDVGQLLRQRAGRIIRELPFLDSLAPVGIAVADPEDRILLRGRIDALIPMDDGLVVIDYKTDYAAPSPDSTRYSEYARQVQAYRQALERSGHGPVLGAKLIFLRARTILEM